MPKIAERGAPGRPHRLSKASTARRSAPPSSSAAQPGRKPRERGSLPVIVRNGSRRARGRANIPGNPGPKRVLACPMPPIPPSTAAPTAPCAKGDHVFLVDGSSYIFRAYHALPPLTRKSDGLPIGAVAGFCNMLWRLLRDTVDGREADPSRPWCSTTPRRPSATRSTTRYKAQRPEPPEDLRPQFRLIREAVRAFDIPCVEQEGYEADDIIATYARARLRGRRDDHHRGLRQGPDAARRQWRVDVRHHEGKAHRAATRWSRSSACRPRRSSTCRR